MNKRQKKKFYDKMIFKYQNKRLNFLLCLKKSRYNPRQIGKTFRINKYDEYSTIYWNYIEKRSLLNEKRK